ncbi:MAG: hypothetical protein AB7K08_00340 [Microbacteriaceae bacterium]
MSDPRLRTKPWQILVTVAVVLLLVVGGAVVIGNWASNACFAPCLPPPAGDEP